MSRSILEDFVRDYVETIGGVWDEVEPQVYDLIVPADEAGSPASAAENPVLRVAFDPEAIPEHPGAQLASFGTPLVDHFLTEACKRGQFAQLYFLGLNLAPYDLAGRVRRSLKLTDLELRIERIRALHFAQALFWFQATFISDQKEQEIVAVALDLHQGRHMRHEAKLLDHARLAEQPASLLAEAPRLSLAAAFPLAKDEALRVLGPMASARDRALRERLERQEARMRRYYADLRAELDAAPSRTRDPEEARAKRAARQSALEREERARIAELHQKNSLRVQARLHNMLVIQQPKLLLRSSLLSPKHNPVSLDLVWDPLVDALEAAACPHCKRPTFALRPDRVKGVVCPLCERAAAKS
jgi:hypothetical protein